MDESIAALRTQLRWLKVAVAVLTIGVVVAIAAAFRSQETPAVLSVERLEIREPDGQLAFVLANSAHPAPATIDGEVIMEGQEKEREKPTFIFFDGKGDEVGGMLFSNDKTDDGFFAGRHFSLDGYKQDQTVVLHHYQHPGGASSGLTVSNRPQRSIRETEADLGLAPGSSREQLEAAFERIPEGEREAKLRELYGGPRLFVGSSWENEASVVLMDAQGRTRIHLGVPAVGDPFIQILDEQGKPVLHLPGPPASSDEELGSGGSPGKNADQQRSD